MKYLVFLFCFLSLEAKTVYFVNYSKHLHRKFFYDPKYLRDEISKPFCVLREELEKAGYRVGYSYDGKDLQEDFFALISINEINESLLASISSYPKERCFLLAFDPPIVLPMAYDEEKNGPFGRIYVMFDDLIDEKHYFKFHFPQPRLEILPGALPFEKKKLCTLIAVNREYSGQYHLLRNEMITFYASMRRGPFDLYGHNWEGYRDWKGSVRHKWPILQKYRFCYCYENTLHQVGYITEKIFDAFVSGCVPVYKGADNIDSYVPRECYIDRNEFASEWDLYNYLNSMDVETYNSYIEPIRDYLASEQAKAFSCAAFAKLILEALQELE